MIQSITIHRVDDFVRFPAEQWNSLATRSAAPEVFQTWEWQSSWWESFRRDQLLLIAAEREGKTAALAPMFADGGMVFFVGSGGSDYLDFLGQIDDPDVLDGILDAARRAVPDFCGFLFYHVPDESPTGRLLKEAAARLRLRYVELESQRAPYVKLPEEGIPPQANKTSLRRHQRYFEKQGRLEVEHLTSASDIDACIDGLFTQHRERWAGTRSPSLFEDERQCMFYRRLTQAAAPAGLIRFTRVLWKSRPIAHHFGFLYRGSYLWYKPSFDIGLAKHSPGEVLLRQLLIAATREKAERFDLGLGDEPFKSRFATGVRSVRNHGLYPKEALR